MMGISDMSSSGNMKLNDEGFHAGGADSLMSSQRLRSGGVDQSVGELFQCVGRMREKIIFQDSGARMS